MKTLLLKAVRRLRNASLLAMLTGSYVAFGQSDYYGHTDSAKPYWKLQTDAATQKTQIRFYNRQHEPIYQETLSGRYVKLTNRNIRVFDEMLQRLLSNQLLAPQLRSHELSVDRSGGAYQAVSTPPSDPVTTLYVLDSPPEGQDLSPLRSDVSINNTGRLKIFINNVYQELILVTILNDQGRYVYKEKNAQLHYNRTLNLTQLPEGRFRLEVDGAQKSYRYRLMIQENPRSYVLKPIR
ncbi:hypothetical protein ACO2Q8_01015 [Larkinella sp. VNQ87]|uniref:hypothetical protein n=1 Tax=Larkinella sp. VNQ87 TaxID=3400921 RepID=UPI003C0C0A85